MGIGRGFSRLWAGNAAGNLGDGISFIAIPLVATSLTVDPVAIAGLAATYSGVRLVAVLPIGVLVDRIDRRTLLWTANLVRAVLLLALAAAFATGHGSLALLFAVTAAIGVIETAADNTALAILPSIVPARHLDRANGRVSAAQLVADEFVGPPLGGVLVALGTALPLLASGALYAGAALFFLALPRRSRAAAREAGAERMLSAPISAFSMVIEGAGWLRGHRLLGGLAIVGGLASVAYAAPFAVLVLVATERLGLDAAGYGVLLAVSALGGLVGSFVTARLRGRWGYRRTIVGSVVLGAGTMAALAGVTVPWVAAVLLAGYIGHAVVWGICVSSLRQRLVPDRLRGRVNASSKLLSLAGLTLGALLGGTLASGVGLAAPFALAAVLFAGCAVAVRALLRPDS